MLNLILAIISSALVSIMMRVGEGRVKNNIGFLSVNYGLCFLFACVYMNVDRLFMFGEGYGTAIGLGSLNGFIYIGSLLIFQYNVKKNGVVLSSVFMKLGILVPIMMSIIVFHESPTLRQICGFIVAIIAIIIINFEKDSAMVTFKIGLIFVLLICGCADGMSKVYEEIGEAVYEEHFLVVTFLMAFLLSLALIVYKKQRIGKEELLYGALLGVPNYYSARFLLKALGEVPAVVAYPTFSVATIALISLTGIIVFKEKISKKQILAIGIIAFSLILLN